jgi:ligand-binding SRPBCC domain-containing protein
MEKGRIIDYTIRVMGLTTRWRTLITCYDPPRYFVDEQLSGPYSFWHHTHRFEQAGEGTLLFDEVRYALPILLFGPARDILHTLYVRPVLEHIFDYRQQVFQDLFGGAPATGAAEPHPPTNSEENAA